MLSLVVTDATLPRIVTSGICVSSSAVKKTFTRLPAPAIAVLAKLLELIPT